MTDLADILKQYPAECRPRHVEPLGSAGGLSGARFWRLATPGGTLVLRRWPAEHPTPERLQLIHAVLQHAARRGMRILPVPIATSSGATFVSHAGHLWELAPWLPGSADYERAPSVARLRAAMTALAEFHLAVADFPRDAPSFQGGAGGGSSAPPAVTLRLARLGELQSGGIDTLARAIDDKTWPEFAPLARRFVAALPRAVPPAIAQLAPLADVPLPLQVCIRDIWHENVLFEGDQVTGLVDFGATAIDTPATDVARLLGSCVVSPPLEGEGLGEGCSHPERAWHEGLAAYTARRPLTDAELRAIPALDAASTLLAGCNWIRWICVERRQFERFDDIIERIRQIAYRTMAAHGST